MLTLRNEPKLVIPATPLPSYTLGPWIAEKGYHNGLNNVISIEHLGYAPRRVIAEIWAGKNEELSEEDWANARLLTLAPDLIGHLRTTASLLKSYSISDHCTQFEIRQCEAVMRKIRGEVAP